MMLGKTFGTEKGSCWSGEGDFLWTRWLDSKYGLMRHLCALEKRNCQAWIQRCVTWVTRGRAGLVRQEDCVKAGVFGRKDQKFNLGYSLDVQREVSILDLSRIVNSIFHQVLIPSSSSSQHLLLSFVYRLWDSVMPNFRYCTASMTESPAPHPLQSVHLLKGNDPLCPTYLLLHAAVTQLPQLTS